MPLGAPSPRVLNGGQAFRLQQENPQLQVQGRILSSRYLQEARIGARQGDITVSEAGCVQMTGAGNGARFIPDRATDQALLRRLKAGIGHRIA